MNQYEEIVRIRGNEPGTVSMILAGVHGDEVCGVAALATLIPQLSIQKGEVIIAYGNARAIAANTRYTEANLNRMFKPDEQLTNDEKRSYEYARAQELKQLIGQADSLLDVHASYVPESKSFIICEDNAKDIAQYLPGELMVSGFDAVEPGGTDYYMNAIGKIGICLECGYLGEEKSTQIAIEGISLFLQARGHVSGTQTAQKRSHIRMYDLYFTKTDSFKLTKKYADFDKIAKGELIGRDGATEVRAERDSIILFARDVQSQGEEAFLLGEYISQ